MEQRISTISRNYVMPKQKILIKVSDAFRGLALLAKILDFKNISMKSWIQVQPTKNTERAKCKFKESKAL